MLQDLPYYTADLKLQEKLFSYKNVEAHTGTKVTGYVIEDDKLTGVRYIERGEEHMIKCDGVFLAVGLVPDNKAFKELAQLDDAGYFAAGEDLTTCTEGVFVAGDCRTKSLRQVTTACADGAIAAIAACDYVSSLK